ncbi:MAG: CBS domain-containing protein [Candidatus Brocadiales bacterium]
MKRNVITTSPEINIKEAAKTMADNHIGSLIVLKNNRAIGMLTERDILCCLAGSDENEIDSKKVRDAMTNYIISITPASAIRKAVKLMTENNVKKLPVIDEKLVGIITASNIVEAQPRMIKDVKTLLLRSKSLSE